ncbi:hypothetical protein PHYBOEH_008844 [Phytophthora boehmeriae]|uniref:Uncharacterized protein n=1 Tax=Phytophthora boehmeriae TaxID=109152 RepID=A0A8T1WZK3_9STRA|nr:hypothetical protein PHYBOEH_008844 [Phytophthora boehmeriae]
MSSKREYYLQKGLQLQQLNEQTTSSSAQGKAPSREVAKYRELCPPGTPDSQISVLIGQCKGNAQSMENAISELWEDYRGNGQDDAWATVSKKTSKKKLDHSYSSQRSYSSQKTHQDDDSEAPQDGDNAQYPRSSERFSTRGRGMNSGTRGNRNGENEEDNTENENDSTDGSNPASDARVQQSSRTSKDTSSSKRDRGAKSTKATPPVAETPPVVHPVLTGAWVKKPNLAGVISKPKPVEPVPAPKPVEKPAEKPTVSTDAEVDSVSATSEAPKSASPKKKMQQDKKSKKTQKSSDNAPAEDVVEKTEAAKSVDKIVSPKASPKKTVEKKKTTTKETTVDTSTSNIAAGWGTLDVSTSTIGEWSASTPSATTEPKKASTPNAWGRGSPVLSTPKTNESAVPKSPIADAKPTIVPGSPKDIDVPRSSGSDSTSPRPYLKMGKWDTGAANNLSLQFGSFSLNGMDQMEATSPRGWASTTTTTSTTNSNSGKTVTKSTTTQSAWGNTAKASSPKKAALSPDRTSDPAAASTKTTSSAPPGLSVDSGRATPTTGQSPRYAPSAPSPASLPKPDEVKRSTPTRAQGTAFQAQGGASAQANKMNIGYGTGLYQASYGQYSMDLGRSAASSTPGQQLPTGSGTPKSAGARGNAPAAVAAQSPSRTQQPVAQMQQIPLQQQAQQQQQQQVQQQAQQKQVQQAQQQQTQQQQQSQQNQQNQSQQQTAAQMQQQGQAGMQQGYPHHYAPPPPPGMALPYNPYNYGGYYQNYPYYQNPQFPQYSPRTQYPPRGSMPYGVDGPVPGFSNPPNMPVGYQDQHLMAQQHEYAGAVPQGFGEINGAYLQQSPMQQQGSHHGHHGHQQNGPQSHGKGGPASGAGSSQQSHGQRGNAMQGYQNAAGGRDHASPPVPNASAAMSGSYGQHYGWPGSYGGQPMGGWGGHMMPQGYQQSPSQQQGQQQGQQQQQQHPNAHQQSYRQYGNGGAQGGNAGSDVNNAHSWSS